MEQFRGSNEIRICLRLSTRAEKTLQEYPTIHDFLRDTSKIAKYTTHDLKCVIKEE